MIKQWLYIMGIAIYGFFFVTLIVTCAAAWLTWGSIHWYNVAGMLGQFLIGLGGVIAALVYMINAESK